MREYPKIETLYDRDTKFKVAPERLRLPEFALINRWQITEKIDGTNVRIGMGLDGSVTYGGRTDNAQMPVPLSEYLRLTFTAEKMQAVFAESLGNTEVVLFGEGYGPKIQNGGAYRPTVGVRLIDVLVGDWWLEPTNILGIATTLGVATVPVLGEVVYLPRSVDDLRAMLKGGQSQAAKEDGGAGCQAEGIVARTVPLLFTRRGDRLLWKLKFKDF
ncbi:MAG: hypothetical protein FJZ89_14805 [Chloroflexi bacterium]|nr:hypothetical protein [Chloroflexota bacterium]